MPSTPTLHLRSTPYELGNDNPIPVTVRLYRNFQPMSWSMSSQLSGRWCWDSFPRHHFICYTIWHYTVVPFDQELAQLRYSLTCLFLQATAMALFSLTSSSGVHFLIYHLPGQSMHTERALRRYDSFDSKFESYESAPHVLIGGATAGRPWRRKPNFKN
jgi:hypothetical protein